MNGMALRTVRSRWRLFLGTFIAVTFGVMVMAGMLNVLFAINQKRQSQDGPTRYAAASAIIVADQRLYNTQGDGSGQMVTLQDWRLLPASTAQAVSKAEGVSEVVIDRSFMAAITGKTGAVQPENRQLGHGWSSAQLAPFHLVSGSEPQVGQVVITEAISHAAKLNLDDIATVTTPEGVKRFTVSGIARTAYADRLPGEDSLFFNDSEAAQLSATPQKAAAIGIVAKPGHDPERLRGELRASLADAGADKSLRIKIGTDKGGNVAADIYNATTASALDLIAFTIPITGFVCIFVVVATSSFAIIQRRQEMALLRLIGATPRQVTRMVMCESLAVAFAAAITGSLLAIVFDYVLSALLRHYGLVPSTFVASGAWPGYLLASAIGVFVVLAGVFFASRQAGKVRAVEAMRSAVVEQQAMSRTRWIWGVIFLTISIGMVILGVIIGGVAALALAVLETEMLAVALALLMPVLVRPIVQFLTIPLVKRTASVGLLSRANLQNTVRRTASTVVPILLTVSITVSMIGVNATLAKTDQVNASMRTQATDIISTEGVTIPVKSAAALQKIPGVSSVVAVPSSTLYPAFDVTGAVTFGTVDAARLGAFDIDVLSGTLEHLGKNDIVVNILSSQESGWKTGDTVTAYLPDGVKTSLHVAAVVNMPTDLPSILLSPQLADDHTNTPMTDTVFVRSDGNTNAGAALQAFADSVGGQLQTKQAWLDQKAVAGDQGSVVATILILGIALSYLGIAIANTSLMAVSDRGRDIEILQKLGASNRQIIGMIAWETTIVVAIGSLLGISAAAVTIASVHKALTVIVPNAPISFFEPGYFVVVGVSLLIALAASVLPVMRRVGRGSLARLREF